MKKVAKGNLERALAGHVRRLQACEKCPHNHRPAVCGGPVVSRVMLIGQAPGTKEPIVGRPFAWTAGRKLFRWLEESPGLNEEAMRSSIYFAAVCRCFPGKNPKGGDRVPSPEEMETCSDWLKREYELLRPQLLIPVGKLAITTLVGEAPLTETISKVLRVNAGGRQVDAIPLPHPSGASPWPHQEPGKTLLAKALKLLAGHPAMVAITKG
jgi:uracil-DNA glycosylase